MDESGAVTPPAEGSRAAGPSADGPPADGPRVGTLRVETLCAPIDVGTRRPRFSWTVTVAGAAAIAGYELVVADRDGGTVWETERSRPDDGVLVEYDGPPLRSDTDYHWRVRPVLAGGARGEWVHSSFSTALLAPADWIAPWVSPPQTPTHIERWTLLDWILQKGPSTGPAERLRPVQLLRQALVVRPGVTRARLYATAHGSYRARVNGVPADDQVLAPGFDSYRHRVSAQCYDVTAQLRAGENVIGLELADGWWAGRIGIAGASAHWGSETAASWQLHLEYADGLREVIPCGGDVVTSPGPWEYADLFVGESLDRGAEQTGWDRPGFAAEGWMPARLLPDDTATIVPFEGAPIRRTAVLEPVSVTETDAGVVVDFGQVIAGRVRLTLPRARAGQLVTIEHTETLGADGEWFVNISGINKEQTDHYRAAGHGDGEVFEPVFTFHGFRYARLRGLDAPPAAGEVVAVVIGSDLESTGDFRSSDPRLNRLHDNVVWSQRANFLSVPTDCPQRERMGWTGDIQVFAAAATNNMDVDVFLSRWLRNLRADQLEDGRIPVFSPYSPHDRGAAEAASGLGGIIASAGWSDAIAIVPWTLYERYGDERVLQENYDALRAWIGHQTRSAQGSGGHPLLFTAGDHFGDWLTPSTLRGKPLHEAIGIAPALTSELVAPMFQAWTLTLAARIATVLGRPAEAAEHAHHAAAVRAAFTAEYLDADSRLPVELQGPYAIALAFDMVPDDRRSALADRLAELVRSNGDRLDTGFLSVPYLLDALWTGGHRELARRVLWQSGQPSWLYEVDHGATTMWESWDAVEEDGTPRAVSLNHYAFGCVDDWLYRRVAGIQSTAPGYRSVLIDPDLACGLRTVDAHVTTPYGRLAVRWSIGEDALATVAVEVPFGVAASLRTPDGDRALGVGTSIHTVRLDRAAEVARSAG
ncbi:family 78 glycoside hydrolase catalytic domain [Galbitalea soli]|uniref:alpha-L-rhamnosidase n=1 Tax=Galbitalea soli TaxID=1268042 RepID=A0A7C9TRZ6_9MICO|nr:family 78 glycoside hydrolase catalytic domain [Galbitalea soli]NEM91961.1 family 78 glycoside hydrolase catalytic domain [Galbitalea soli]NYJ32091.1 alpha-L-rhamnosidase [Galbitalea soli]